MSFLIYLPAASIAYNRLIRSSGVARSVQHLSRRCAMYLWTCGQYWLEQHSRPRATASRLGRA